MDREKFKAGMDSDIWLSSTRSARMTADVAKTTCEETNILWLIEEMAELQQALIKHQRGFDNWYDVLQELADVRIGLEILLYPDENGVTFCSRNQFDKAIDVKLDRDYRRINSDNVT